MAVRRKYLFLATYAHAPTQTRTHGGGKKLLILNKSGLPELSRSIGFQAASVKRAGLLLAASRAGGAHLMHHNRPDQAQLFRDATDM